MINNNYNIGTDIEEVSRFACKTLENDYKFLSRIFTSNELDYCYKNINPETHLCARFCAKEAVIKALSGLNISDVYYKDIEISKFENGRPYVILEKYPNLDIKTSISHCKKYATATVIINKGEH